MLVPEVLPDQCVAARCPIHHDNERSRHQCALRLIRATAGRWLAWYRYVNHPCMIGATTTQQRILLVKFGLAFHYIAAGAVDICMADLLQVLHDASQLDQANARRGLSGNSAAGVEAVVAWAEEQSPVVSVLLTDSGSI